MPKKGATPQQPSQSGKNRNTKIKVLAKMLVKQVRKADGEFSDPTTASVSNMPNIPPTKKIRKPRAPATGKALAWQQTFAQVRKKYPGKNSPEFQLALKAAGEKHRAKYGSASKPGQTPK